MKTFLTEAGEDRLRTLIEHYNASLKSGDAGEALEAASELREIVHVHTLACDHSFTDLRERVEALERELQNH